MPTKYSLSNECKEDLIAWRRAGFGSPSCSEKLYAKYGLRVPSSTLGDWLKKWGVELGPKISILDKVKIIEQIDTDKKHKVLEAERNHYKTLYETSIKESSHIDKIVATIREVSAALPEVEIKFRADKEEARTHQTAVAPLCDTHIGEKVDFDQMAGLNQYNMAIFNKRLKGWASLVVSLTEFRRRYAPVRKLVVPMLGDMVSGEIHLDMAKTNVDNVLNSMARGANLIAQALVFLSQYFEEIYVPCVVGNHGRIAERPPAKDRYVDWDYLLYQWVAAFSSHNKRISFSIPKSFLHVFRVADHNILMLHGDSIKSWQSIPYYGIVRTVAQLRQVLQFKRGLEEDITNLIQRKSSSGEFLSVIASYFDSVLIGHFHRHDEIDIGTGEALIAGCLKGGDEYAFGKLHTISKPKQILTYWHPKYGYIGKDIIYLEKFDTSDDKFVDVLPEVWVEAKLGNKV